MRNQQFQPHRSPRFQGASFPVDYGTQCAPPSQPLDVSDEPTQTLLEELDDVIFAAISGNATALSEARLLWTRTVTELGWQQVEESREQYLRYAVDVTLRFEQEEIRSPERAIAALDVIELLTKS